MAVGNVGMVVVVTELGDLIAACPGLSLDFLAPLSLSFTGAPVLLPYLEGYIFTV